MLQVSIQLSVSVSVNFDFFDFSFSGYLRFQVSSLNPSGFVTDSLSVSVIRSLERGGVSELSQAQIDRYGKPSGSALARTLPR
jgi:hypothetical protein